MMKKLKQNEGGSEMYQSKRKKIVSKIVTLGMVVMLFASMGMMGASANVGNNTFGFNFNGGGMRYTSQARKDNTSSMYMFCQSQTTYYTYTAWAQGGNSGGPFVNCDKNGQFRYTFANGTSSNILNLVRENGYSYCRIAAQPNGSGAYYASGTWKADTY